MSSRGRQWGLPFSTAIRACPNPAKVLIDAFKQFDIPHQVGVTAQYAAADSATAELFVAKKP